MPLQRPIGILWDRPYSIKPFDTINERHPGYRPKAKLYPAEFRPRLRVEDGANCVFRGFQPSRTSAQGSLKDCSHRNRHCEHTNRHGGTERRRIPIVPTTLDIIPSNADLPPAESMDSVESIPLSIQNSSQETFHRISRAGCHIRYSFGACDNLMGACAKGNPLFVTLQHDISIPSAFMQDSTLHLLPEKVRRRQDSKVPFATRLSALTHAPLGARSLKRWCGANKGGKNSRR